MKTPIQVVQEQINDDGLWFIARTAPEAYLQRELRRLHAAVEMAQPEKTYRQGAEEMREAVFQQAARMRALEDALVFLRPALAVLRNMCRTAGLRAGEAKAEEMNQHLRAVLTAEDPRDPHPTREGMFRLHDCSRCNDGALPCKQGNPRQCEFPHARDD